MSADRKQGIIACVHCGGKMHLPLPQYGALCVAACLIIVDISDAEDAKVVTRMASWTRKMRSEM